MIEVRIGLDLGFECDGNNVLSINFTKLDDFHPDNILRQLPLFTNRQHIRRRLINKDSLIKQQKKFIFG